MITTTKQSGSKPPTIKMTVPQSPASVRKVHEMRGLSNPRHVHIPLNKILKLLGIGAIVGLWLYYWL